MADQKTKAVVYNDEESWQNARKLASLIGEIPPLFSSATRALNLEPSKGTGEIGARANFHLTRLYNSASVKAPLYFAALTFRPEQLAAAGNSLDLRAFCNLFDGAELSAVVGLTYLYKRVARSTPAEEFEFIARPCQDLCEIGGHLGLTVPKIGLCTGVLVGALPAIALCAFIRHDKKGFKEYRRFLKQKNLLTDTATEVERWGCTHAQICSILIQSLGLGVKLADAFTSGLTTASLEDPKLDEEAYRVKATRILIETLYKSCSLPTFTMKAELLPAQQEVEKLKALVAGVKSSGPKHKWLERKKEDVNPDSTPGLFSSEAAAEILSEESPALEQESSEDA